MNHLAKFFFEESARAFAFLIEKHSFSPPKLNVDEQVRFVFVVFTGERIAIETILDEREGDIDCKLARLINGAMPKSYAVNEKREMVRAGVASILRKKGVRERLFRPVGSLPLRERIPITLADFAAMVEKYSAELFTEPFDL